MKTVSESRAFGGVQGVYSHPSEVCGAEMTFGLYLPPAAAFADLSDLLAASHNLFTFDQPLADFDLPWLDASALS